MRSLALKTILGYAFLLLSLAASLFAPAWTLHFWQAWVYLVLFAAASAGITAYLWKHDPALLERRVKAGPIAEKELNQKLIQIFASLAFVGIMILPSLDHRFSWSRVPLGFVILGDMLVALGFWVVFHVYKENSFAAATIAVAADQKVISTGPYAIVRHPMYSGALQLLFGTPLALGSWWGILMFLPMLLVMIFRLLDEESFLRKFLAGYDGYCRKVPYRLVPSVW